MKYAGAIQFLSKLLLNFLYDSDNLITALPEANISSSNIKLEILTQIFFLHNIYILRNTLNIVVDNGYCGLKWKLKIVIRATRPPHHPQKLHKIKILKFYWAQFSLLTCFIQYFWLQLIYVLIRNRLWLENVVNFKLQL